MFIGNFIITPNDLEQPIERGLSNLSDGIDATAINYYLWTCGLVLKYLCTYHVYLSSCGKLRGYLHICRYVPNLENPILQLVTFL